MLISTNIHTNRDLAALPSNHSLVIRICRLCFTNYSVLDRSKGFGFAARDARNRERAANRLTNNVTAVDPALTSVRTGGEVL